MATGWWKGATNGVWTTNTNWYELQGGTTTVSAFPQDVNNDTAYFTATGISTAQSIYLNGSKSVLGLVFNGNAGSISILGGTSTAKSDQMLTVGTGGISSTSSFQDLTIGGISPGNVHISPVGDFLVTTVNRSISLNGRIDNTVLAQITLSVTGSGSINLYGVVNNGYIGSTRLLVNSSGSGAVSLYESNTYAGGTTVSAGLLRIYKSDSLGTGTLTMTSGTFNFANNTLFDSIPNNLSLSGSITLLGWLKLNGTTTVTANTTITNSTTNLDISGSLYGSGNLTVTGGSIRFIGIYGPYSGIYTNSTATTTIVGNYSVGQPNQFSSASKMVVSGTGQIQLAGGSAYTFSRTIEGTGIFVVRNSNSSGITFTGTMSGFTGSLRIFADTNESAATSQKITITSANQFAFAEFRFTSGNGITSGLNQILSYTGSSSASSSANIYLTPGTTSSTVINYKIDNSSISNGALTLSGQTVLDANYDEILELSTTAGDINITNGLRGPYSTFTGKLSILKTGSYTVTNSGSSNSFTGSVDISAGRYNANHASALGTNSGGSIMVRSGATLSLGASINLPARTIDLYGSLILSDNTAKTFGGVSLGATTFVSSTSGGLLSAPISMNTNFLNLRASSGSTLEISGVITGTTRLTVGSSDSTGSVLISGSNLLTGGVTVSYGTLNVKNANALGTSNTIVLDGAILKFSDGITTDLSYRIVLSANKTSTIDVTNNFINFNSSLNQNITNNASLVVTGSGTLSLNTPNVYTGVTYVTNGSLCLSHPRAIKGACSLSSGSKLIIGTLDGQAVINGNLSTNNSTIKIGVGIVNSYNAFIYTPITDFDNKPFLLQLDPDIITSPGSYAIVYSPVALVNYVGISNLSGFVGSSPFSIIYSSPSGPGDTVRIDNIIYFALLVVIG